MLVTPDEYRRKADKCARLAAEAVDPGLRSDYEQVARSYRHLAAEVEMLEEHGHIDRKR